MGPSIRAVLKRGFRPEVNGNYYGYDERDKWHGQPAVALTMGGRSGTGVYEDPEDLRQLTVEIEAAADWLQEQKGEAE